ncbi:hypothetical protein ALO40_200107 [Pseudomonas syringae pv. viburni]|uniref:Type II toxin-antitoxin system PemK/MazF family toxin n=1 Tax=Pseudomonas syringae pv. viburni TaxID=251703 RepID=A0A0Q0CHF1_9PSED|nr:hypothetical protein ALO40_200107 [Pseudomonas syringae pv. viburni]
MALTYTPKVGEVLECDFGDFVKPPLKPVYNGLMTPEIRKRRMVVVLNGRLPNGCTMVVPISSSGNPNAVQRGMHVFWTLHSSLSRVFTISVIGGPLPSASRTYLKIA